MKLYFLPNTVRRRRSDPEVLSNYLYVSANEFPSSFESIVRKIVRLLFHVIAHLYAAHFREVVLLGLHAHLNLTFAHLTALHNRFSLIETKETEVLRDLELALRLTEDTTQQSEFNNAGRSGNEASTAAIVNNEPENGSQPTTAPTDLDPSSEVTRA